MTASAAFAGDTNHTISSGSATFSITPAASVVTISCGVVTLTYDGEAKEPCTAEVTGAGALKQPVDVAYEDNIDAGTATVTASYPGDSNHDTGSATSTFSIA